MNEYNTFKAAVAGMNIDIEEQQRLLDKSEELTAPIAQYSGMPRGGGGNGLNGVEAAAQDRIHRQNEIYRQMLNRDEIQRLIDKIDWALSTLPQEDQYILKEHYFDRISWEKIGNNHSYSERWAREKGGKALRKVAFVLFGVRARPQQLSFVFAQ
ncbi:MAG: hypothetical protein IJ709_00285 [Selenomonas sp.]|nr:hypothetical protein [Selenomonas sp.]